MTLEEALVLLLAGVAGLLLFLGLAQALENRPPRPMRKHRVERSRRRPVPLSAREAHGASSPEAHEQPPAPVIEPAVPVDPLSAAAPAASAAAPHPATHDALSPEPEPLELPVFLSMTPQPMEPPPHATMGPESAEAWSEQPTAVEPVFEELRHAEPEPVEAPAPTAVPADSEMALLGRCATLYVGAEHSELLAAAEPYLRAAEEEDRSHLSHAMTALWTLTGLSRETLGDQAGARVALLAAQGAAPEPAWEACPPWLAALAVSVGEELLDIAGRSPQGSEDRATGPRLASVWLGWRLGMAPNDPEALGLRERAREALEEARRAGVTALIRRRDFGAARRLIQEGLDSGETSAPQGDAMLDFLSTALSREIGRLTAPAIRAATADDRQAVAALESAQAMLSSMLDAALAPQQRMAMIRRIWRGYSGLGIWRLKSGHLEAALEALFHALGTKEVDPRRQGRVRDALVQALDGMARLKAESIARLLGQGDRSAARAELEPLLAHIQRAKEGGVAKKKLAPVAARAQELTAQVEQAEGR